MPTTISTKTTPRDRVRYNVKRSDVIGGKKESMEAPSSPSKSPKPKGPVSVSKVSARKPSSTKIAKGVAANDSKNKVLKEEVVNVETEVQGDLIIKRETVVRTLSPAKEATEGTFKLRKAADDAPMVAQPGRNAVTKTLHDGKAIDLKTDAKYTKDMPRERVLIKKRDSTPTTRFPEGERTPGSEEAGRMETFVRETVTRRPQPVDLTPAPAPAPPPPPPPPRAATPPPPPEPKPEPPRPKSPTKPANDGGDNKGATRQRISVLLNQNLHRKDGFSKTQPFKPGQKLQDDVVIIKKKEVKYDKDNKPIEDIDEVVRVKAYEDGAHSPKSPKRASVVKK